MKIATKRMDVLCEHGAHLLLGLTGLDPVALLKAISQVESSYGQNSNSHHEKGYCYGGAYYNSALTKLYGCEAHCSYGPWQVMYPTALELMQGIVPYDLQSPETSLVVATMYINRAISRGADSLEKIADAYNSGSFKDSNVPAAYIAKVQEAYRLAKG